MMRRRGRKQVCRRYKQRFGRLSVGRVTGSSDGGRDDFKTKPILNFRAGSFKETILTFVSDSRHS